MRRIILLVTVALVMTAIMLAVGAAAGFAQAMHRSGTDGRHLAYVSLECGYDGGACTTPVTASASASASAPASASASDPRDEDSLNAFF